MTTPDVHEAEPHSTNAAARLNWLRAGVLGANDGIVSLSGLVIGVAASGVSLDAIRAAGLAGLASGALSMAVGEYVSVSTQRDTEAALLEKERRELAEQPEEELDELTAIYRAKGLSPDLARQVAVELTERDALAIHAEVELGIDAEELTNPWAAAFASMVSFTLGAIIPFLTMILLPTDVRIPATVAAAVVALAVTGWVSAHLGGAARGRALVRNVGGGLLAMGVTYWIGVLFGTTVA